MNFIELGTADWGNKMDLSLIITKLYMGGWFYICGWNAVAALYEISLE